MTNLWWILVLVGLVMGTFFAAVYASQRLAFRYIEALLHALVWYAIAAVAAYLATSPAIRSWGGYLIAGLFALEIAIRLLPGPDVDTGRQVDRRDLE